MTKDTTLTEPEMASQTTSSQETQIPTFHPDHITLDTFHHLLNCYPDTVEAIARRKAAERAARSSSSAASKKAKRSKPVRPGARARQEQQEDRDTAQTEQDQEQQVDREAREFLKLDERRYRGLPETVRKRGDSDGEGGYLTKEELVEVMEWKLKHGVSRPMLLGMVKGNQDRVVQKATADAFASVPKTEDRGDEDDRVDHDEFPKSSLDMLTGPLRGVGPATASLLLSVGTAARDAVLEVPFYSDDTFLWLCLGVVPSGQGIQGDEGSAKKEERKPRAGVFKPNGEINVKYNVQEYRHLWDAVRALRKRLNAAESSGRHVSCADVEKAALVLRHLEVSPFFEAKTETMGSSTSERKRKRSEKT